MADAPDLSNIDFQSYLAGDETYRKAIEAINQARAADQEARNADIYQNLIRFGEVPTDPRSTSLMSGEGFTLRPDIVDLINQSTASGFSQVGQLMKSYRDAQSLQRGNLGERGIIRSGDYAYLTNKNENARELQRANFLDALQGNILGANKNYLSLVDALRGEQSNVGAAAWQRMIDLINARAAAAAATPTATPTATPLPVKGDPTSTPAAPTPDPVWPPGGSGPVYPGVTTTIPDYGGIPVDQIPNTYMQGSAGQGSEYNTGYTSDQPNDFAPLVGNYLQNNPSDAASNYEGAYVAPTTPVPGYGGTTTGPRGGSVVSTYYQNQRNML